MRRSMKFRQGEVGPDPTDRKGSDKFFFSKSSTHLTEGVQWFISRKTIGSREGSNIFTRGGGSNSHENLKNLGVSRGGLAPPPRL